MKFNESIPVFGDVNFRGECKKEDAEQMDFVSWLKFNYPLHYGRLVHVKTEGKRTYQQVNYERRMGGIPTGFSDICIMGKPDFIVELKRKDHTKSRWQNGQEKFIDDMTSLGKFTGVALGADGAKEAFLQWLEIIEKGA